MVALMLVVAALAAISLGLSLLYRWASKFEADDQDETLVGASAREDSGGFAHIGIGEIVRSGSGSHG